MAPIIIAAVPANANQIKELISEHGSPWAFLDIQWNGSQPNLPKHVMVFAQKKPPTFIVATKFGAQVTGVGVLLPPCEQGSPDCSTMEEATLWLRRNALIASKAARGNRST
jgi:hypothetical protein